MGKSLEAVEYSHDMLVLEKIFLKKSNDELEAKNKDLESEIMNLKLTLGKYQKIVDIINNN